VAEQYDVVIVGGGIIGTSIAYHLACDTPARSVCLLERSKLTSGTTWHAAGLVAELRASANLTRLAKYSGELYEALEQAGHGLGYKRPGALTLATHPDRRYELLKQAAMARQNGVGCDWLRPEEIAERWPHLHLDDILGGVYMPRDGQTNPVDTTLALARLARAKGAMILEDTPVTRIKVNNGVATGVYTEATEINAEQVVICAGLWTRNLGLSVGAHFPLYPAEHFYAVTEPVTTPTNAPIVRVPDDGIYLKPEAGRLLIGCFERDAKPLAPESLPADFSFDELPFDLDHFAPYLQRALARVPEATQTGIRTWFNGPESFTPDGRYLLGESPQVEQLFVAAGFNSIGIQSAGGVGKVMTQWLHQRRPPMDLWEVDVRRFSPLHNETQYLIERTSESLGLLYAMHWPHFESASARNQKQSPVHAELAAAGACFGELAGWERPNWYAAPGETARYQYSYGKQNWFERTRIEHQAVRHNVALFDQTSFAKYLISGPDACRFLNRLSTANVDIPIGNVVYCQWLNESGGIEADITLTRIAEDEFWVISAAASVTRDLHWLARHAREFRVTCTNISERYAVFAVMGPNARVHLQALTEHSLANADFPFATSANLEIGGCTVRAIRITYVGELGWELYVPWQDAPAVYATLTREPIQHAGYHAMNSLRLEKAYRHWGHDISDEDNPLQAGLSFTCDFTKPGGFIGDNALIEQQSRNLTRRLALFKLDNSETLLTHDEPIWDGEQRVGHIVSSGYSYHENCSLGFGYVHNVAGISRQALLAGHYTVEVADQYINATVSLRAVYDPDNLRIHV